MLSFLRDQEHNGPEGQESKAAVQSDPNLLKKTQGQEYLTVAAQSKNVRNSTVLVIVLFSIGLVGLWFMIKKSHPKAASASPAVNEEEQIEMAISRITGVRSEMLSRMDQVVKKFYEFSNILQVQVNDLVKNPFEIELFLNSLTTKVRSKHEDLDIDEDLLRHQQLRRQIQSMQLLCIMQSSRGNCCVIDDTIFYKGDSIGDFTVTEIGDDFVRLKWVAENQSDSEQPDMQMFETELKLSE